MLVRNICNVAGDADVRCIVEFCRRTSIKCCSIILASADGRGRTHDKNKCRRTEGAMSFHDFEGET